METSNVPDAQIQARADQMFPTLTPAQIARIAAHGSVRPFEAGEVLFEAGDQGIPFLVVTDGEIEIVRPLCATETLVTIHLPGQFTGDVGMLSGRRTLVRARARGAAGGGGAGARR